MQNITPSTRPLIQFVSPNTKKVARLIQIDGSQLAAWASEPTQLNTWEDEEISGLAVNNLPEHVDCIPKIRQIKSILSCPLIVMGAVQNATDLYRLREIDADAVIMPITTLTPAELQDLWLKAGSMNLLLIFCIASESEWQKIAPLKPRFIFVENSFDFLQKVPSETWLIGSENFSDPTKLKCRLEKKIL